MTFTDFATRLDAIEAVSSRLTMTEQLSELYQSLEETELRPASYLLQGSLVPPYKSLEFQLSTKMILRALARVLPAPKVTEDLFGNTVAAPTIEQLEKQYKQVGDVGLLAQTVCEQSPKATSEPSLETVFSQLVDIATISGEGSQEEKVRLLVELLSILTPVGAKYVVRIIIGRLRLGFSTMTLLDALSWARTGGKAHRDSLENAYQKRADVGELAEFYFGLDATVIDSEELLKTAFEEYTVEIGVPVVPALCQRLNSAQEIIDKMGTVIAEPKYDGLRIQVHFKQTPVGPEVVAYTRNLEEVTHMFPELQQLGQTLDVQGAILDAEAIGYDPETDALLPFQQTITRKRKHDIAAAADSVPIRFYLFDILKLNDQPLISMELQQRKELLRQHLKEDATFQFTPYIITTDPVELRSYHETLLGDGLEGAVIKKVDDHYRSGRKGWSWVRIKEAGGTSGKLSDTLDLIVLGYYFGRGKRASLGIGAFLVGALTEDQQIVTVAKIGTGLTEDQFRALKTRIDADKVTEQPELYSVHKGLRPDVWVAPNLVVEIAADEITNSPNHTAGVALRFPRLVQFREDKSWEDATSVGEMESIK